MHIFLEISDSTLSLSLGFSYLIITPSTSSFGPSDTVIEINIGVPQISMFEQLPYLMCFPDELILCRDINFYLYANIDSIYLGL